MTDQAQRLRELARTEEGTRGPRTDRAAASVTRRGAGRCTSIAVSSGKGGVGKSNISLSLAVALARLKRRVLLFDADLGLANIHILLGLTPKHNLHHVILGESSLREALCEGPEGTVILPGASGVADMANLDSLRLESLGRMLQGLEDEFDFIVVDGGAGIGQATMQLAANADATLLVLTPEPTALADVYATAKVLVGKGVEDLRVLVNMAAGDREAREIYDKLAGLVQNFLKRRVQLAAVLPLDREVPRLVRMQLNPVAARPAGRFASAVQSYARTLCGMQGGRKGGFFTRLIVRMRQGGEPQ